MDFRKFLNRQYWNYWYMLEGVFILFIIGINVNCQEQAFFGLIAWIGLMICLGFYKIIYLLGNLNELKGCVVNGKQ